MNLLSWAQIFQIIGTTLLSLYIFKSAIEEKDSSLSWFGNNPFADFNPIRKFLSFIGMSLIIFGFSVNFANSLSIKTLNELGSILPLSVAITASAILLMHIFYIIGGVLYLKKRYHHFSQFPLLELKEYLENKKINIDVLFTRLAKHSENLPPKYAKLYYEALSQKEKQEAYLTKIKSYLEKL